MMTVGLGALVNIVLDPIFIFGMGMGVRGAALATVIAQGCSALWVLRFLTGRRAILRLRVRNMALCAPRVRSIVTLGLSGFFMNLTNSLVQVVCNATLQAYGGEPVRGGDDHHQLAAGGVFHAGAWPEQWRPAGDGVQLRAPGRTAGSAAPSAS